MPCNDDKTHFYGFIYALHISIYALHISLSYWGAAVVRKEFLAFVRIFVCMQKMYAFVGISGRMEQFYAFVRISGCRHFSDIFLQVCI